MTKYYASAIVNQAKAWLGYNEADGSHREIINVYNSHSPKARGYTLRFDDAWCSGFASAVAIKCGYTAIIPTEVGCEKHIELFKAIGCWQENDAYVPAAGDYIFYDWDDSGSGDNKGWSDHVGIVVAVSGSTITVIEGNYSNKVAMRTLKVNGRYIRGYGVPKYDTPMESEVASKSVDVLAQEVLDGKWGNGDARKAALGSMYDAVQAKVNELLKPKPATKSNEQLAKEVWEGKWGNGADRKKLLEDAGYNYDAVQALVEKGVGRKTNEDLAWEVWDGKWGNGKEREQRLTAAGHNYDAVQALVEKGVGKH